MHTPPYLRTARVLNPGEEVDSEILQRELLQH
jgi:hypothetical protein